SYYMVFSLAPLLIIIVAVLGLYYEGSARIELVSRIEEVANPQIAETINHLILSASQPIQSIFASSIAIFTFLIGAIRVLVELRSVLNTIWGFAQKQEEEVNLTVLKHIIQFLVVRILSMFMLLVIGFAILALLVISTYFSVMNSWLAANTPEALPVSNILSPLFGIIATSGFFYLLMRALPAHRPPRRNVLLGAFIAAILFSFGKSLIAMYLARAVTASIYGAASSLVVLMLWVYFSTSIFLYGAQLAATMRISKLEREKLALEKQLAARQAAKEKKESQND
ncbi:MAG: YihY/virulence factor BrkB family protein, partial [Saezia sp.]